MTIELSQEQLELLATITESLKKDKGLLQRITGWGEKDEPTMAGLLKYADQYIRTQHGATSGSFTGELGSLELTISFKVKQEKTTT